MDTDPSVHIRAGWRGVRVYITLSVLTHFVLAQLSSLSF